MGKTYEGNVEVFTNKETRRLTSDTIDDFNKENADALYKFMKQVADKTGYTMQLFVPDASKAEQPVILANPRFGGKPYLCVGEETYELVLSKRLVQLKYSSQLSNQSLESVGNTTLSFL